MTESPAARNPWFQGWLPWPTPLQSSLTYLLVPASWVDASTYRVPSGRGSARVPTQASPAAHGAKLLRQLDTLRSALIEINRDRKALAVANAKGVVVEFESEPGFELFLKSLHSPRLGLELLAVRQGGASQLATVRLTFKGIKRFQTQVDRYLNEKTAKGQPKNQNLVDSVAEMRRAVLRSFWTDTQEDLPDSAEEAWWEVWLRTPDPTLEVVEHFREEASRFDVEVVGEGVRFPDRAVCLARGSLENLGRCAILLDQVAELRKPRLNAAPFLEMEALEEAEWVSDLVSRLSPPNAHAPAALLLDTGIDSSHPLLKSAVAENGLFAYRRDDLEDWGVEDHNGHGTKMSGSILFGDLVEPLESTGLIATPMWLESAKIFPPKGENPRELFGAITLDGISQAELAAPKRRRIICLAVTEPSLQHNGKPSSWSAVLDETASGALDGEERLIVVSAGNSDDNRRADYPGNVLTESVQDPAQAWNVLTIGAFTDRVEIPEAGLHGYTPVAPRGGLSPTTTTSLSWQDDQWPFKPDLLMEGGNLAKAPDGFPGISDGMVLLTTSRRGQLSQRLLTTTYETSAATALAARMAGQIWSAYPDLWPQTVRALMVHSADWTSEMRGLFDLGKSGGRARLLRSCGYGVPDLHRAIWSATDALTLMVQGSLQPFKNDRGRGKMRDIHFHPLPWPAAQLLGLGETRVELRVTLSYFIEPSPGERGWSYKHRYASHGLRFEVCGPQEDPEEFRLRLSTKAQDEEDGRKPKKPSDSGWFLGPKLWKNGSIHSDRWVGLASDLAQRGLMGVYPVIGWWRERLDLGRVDQGCRYALVVSIRSLESVEVDLYTPVLAQIDLSVDVDA